MSRHTLDLTVFPFSQNELQPTDGNGRPIPYRWIPLPEALRLGNTARLTRLRMEIAKVHALGEPLQRFIRGQTFNLRPVQLCQLVPGTGNPRLQSTIVRQYNQTFRICIQPTSRIHITDRNVIGQRGPSAAIGKLGQHAIRFVEKYEAAQIGKLEGTLTSP